MSRFSFPARFAVVFALLANGALADTVVMRDGTRIEGVIKSLTDTEVVIDERVSAGVSELRTLKRSEVDSVLTEKADEVAWAALKGIKVGLHSLPSASYEMPIESLQGFASANPNSPHAAEARAQAAALTAEQKRVDGGEIKLDGKWLGAEEVERNRYQINAKIAFNFMKDQASRDIVGALNTFAAIEKNFPGSRIYPQAVELARRLLPLFKAEAERRAQAVAAAQAARDKEMKTAAEPRKLELVAMTKRDQATTDQVVSAFDKHGFKWIPLFINSERTLKSLASKASSETQRLANVPVDKINESFAAADKAMAALKIEDLTSADTELRQARNAWGQNELIARIEADLTAAKKAAAAKAAAEKAAATPTPAPTPRPAAESATPASAQTTAASEEKSFLRTPAGAVTLVAVIGLLIAGIAAFKSVKGKANDILE